MSDLDEDYIPERGNPMVAFMFPYTVTIDAGWQDCRHGRHPYRATVNFDLTDSEEGCGDTWYAAIREAMRRTPVVA